MDMAIGSPTGLAATGFCGKPLTKHPLQDSSRPGNLRRGAKFFSLEGKISWLPAGAIILLILKRLSAVEGGFQQKAGLFNIARASCPR